MHQKIVFMVSALVWCLWVNKFKFKSQGVVKVVCMIDTSQCKILYNACYVVQCTGNIP